MLTSATKLLKNIGLFLGSFYIIAAALLYFLQGYLLFPAPGDPQAQLPANAEYVETKMPDGVLVKHIRLRNTPDAHKIMFFHGNGSLAYHELLRGLELHQQGFDVLLAEYRGYGGSSGTPSADKLMPDAVATYDQFVSEGSQKVFLYAHSLGTGIATYLASQRKVAAIALEAPYSSTADIAAERYPIFPVRLLLRHDIASATFIQSVTAPVLMIHGEQDQVIPIGFGEKLYSSYDSTNKEWQAISQAGHNNLLSFGSIERVAQFFKRY